MPTQPTVPAFHFAAARTGLPTPGRALALCLLLSVGLHGAGLMLGRPGDGPAPRARAVSGSAPLRLALARRTQGVAAPARPRPGPVAANPAPSAANPGLQAAPSVPAVPPATAAATADGAAADAATVPATGLPTDQDAGAGPPAGAAILAAARREAALTARALNQAPGAERQFRSSAREELDRQFDAAHAAGGAWFRSARIEEITRPSDGGARVYRIVTPFGAFCRSYPANAGQPMNTLCKR